MSSSVASDKLEARSDERKAGVSLAVRRATHLLVAMDAWRLVYHVMLFTYCTSENAIAVFHATVARL